MPSAGALGLPLRRGVRCLSVHVAASLGNKLRTIRQNESLEDQYSHSHGTEQPAGELRRYRVESQPERWV